MPVGTRARPPAAAIRTSVRAYRSMPASPGCRRSGNFMSGSRRRICTRTSEEHTGVNDAAWSSVRKAGTYGTGNTERSERSQIREQRRVLFFGELDVLRILGMVDGDPHG